MAVKKRIGSEGSATWLALLDATEKLMVEEGYASVSTRRVAGELGFTPALVHYYFPSTDDLLLAVYRRTAKRNRDRVSAALASPQPLRALWAMSVESMQTSLAAEFLALANHRKIVGVEIAKNIAHSRAAQTTAFQSAFAARSVSPNIDGSTGMAVMMTAVSRALVMEKAIGVEAGHREAVRLIEVWLNTVEPVSSEPPATATKKRLRPRSAQKY